MENRRKKRKIIMISGKKLDIFQKECIIINGWLVKANHPKKHFG